MKGYETTTRIPDRKQLHLSSDRRMGIDPERRFKTSQAKKEVTIDRALVSIKTRKDREGRSAGNLATGQLFQLIDYPIRIEEG